MGVDIIAAGPWDRGYGARLAARRHGGAGAFEHGLPFMGPPSLAASIAATREAAQADRIDLILSATKDNVEGADDAKPYPQDSPWS